ncbi:hypothetical protein B0H13DRAFT_1928755 [Mycena leptocephala]|nr:hypothetical protein B0H13DRAFT_1928755 [Mycena leptocephala]
MQTDHRPLIPVHRHLSIGTATASELEHSAADGLPPISEKAACCLLSWTLAQYFKSLRLKASMLWVSQATSSTWFKPAIRTSVSSRRKTYETARPSGLSAVNEVIASARGLEVNVTCAAYVHVQYLRWPLDRNWLSKYCAKVHDKRQHAAFSDIGGRPSAALNCVLAQMPLLCRLTGGDAWESTACDPSVTRATCGQDRSPTMTMCGWPNKGATKTLCMMSHRVPLNGAKLGMMWYLSTFYVVLNKIKGEREQRPLFGVTHTCEPHAGYALGCMPPNAVSSLVELYSFNDSNFGTLLKAVWSLNTVRRKGMGKIYILELAEEMLP